MTAIFPDLPVRGVETAELAKLSRRRGSRLRGSSVERLPDARAAAHAIDALRRGWPVRVSANRQQITVLAVETADPTRLENFDPQGIANVIVSAGRAAGLDPIRFDGLEPNAPVSVRQVEAIDLRVATALADPQLDAGSQFKGRLTALDGDTRPAAEVALELARLAGMLPAFFVLADRPCDIFVTREDVAAHEDATRLSIAARAKLPVRGSAEAQIVAFRTPEMPGEHIALIIGKPNGGPPLVRLHSECLTGDMLGSLKCDCGPQLESSVDAIAASGWGILLYLRQEGRGIGLVNKLRAYALQDRGYDTVDANTRLGFAIDARNFATAAQMLHLLGERRIRLLTNNPAKVATLQTTGIDVVERVPHKLPSNPHNERYLATKRDRTGHAL